MGAGRKTKTLPLKEKSEVPWTVNSSPPARNMTKDKLGAVIFGCKKHTITECLTKEIFGLPAAHYSYVKNVTPGLTLFLFNYSDRKLHGIFEAVSSGQMNINPHAWITSEGAENTPYPAQVRVHEQRKCRPLHEEEFKPIIAKNYYAERLFWFELDKEQNKKLMKLFLSSPLPEKMRCPSNAAWQNNMFNVLSSSNVNETAEEEFKNLDSEEYSGMAEMRLKEDERSYASIINRDAFAQEKKWTDLFKPSSSWYAVKDWEVLENSSVSDCFDMEWKSASSSHERSEPPPEPCPDVANTECDSYVAECWEDGAFVDNDVKEIHENKVACLQYHDRDSDWPDLTDLPSAKNRTFLDGEGGKLKPSELNTVLTKELGEALIDTKEKVESGIALAPVENCERGIGQPNLTDRAFQGDCNAMSRGVLRGVQSSDFQYVIVKLMQEIEGLKVSQLKQRLKIDTLEHELVNSKLEIDQLKKRCHKLESMHLYQGSQ